MNFKAPGYYVEGRYYGTRYFQARARAAHLEKLSGRPVVVETAGMSVVSGVSTVDSSLPFLLQRQAG